MLNRNNILNIPSFSPVYSTGFGAAYLADSIQLLKQIPSNSLDLIMTSPPFALIKKKTYGNEAAPDYVQWFIDNFALELYSVATLISYLFGLST